MQYIRFILHGGCKVGSASDEVPRNPFFWWLWYGFAAPQPPEGIIWGGARRAPGSLKPHRNGTLQPPCFILPSRAKSSEDHISKPCCAARIQCSFFRH